MSARDRLSASTCRPSSSRSSRISSITIPFSMSMSRKAGCDRTSPKRAQASATDSGGSVSEKIPWSTCVDANSDPPSRSKARFTACALGTRLVPR
jgi:hypothetical protein